jgi:AraC family transcriptional regulator
LHVCAVLAGGFVERRGSSWVDVGPGTLRVSGAARHDIDFSSSGAVCLLLQPRDVDFPALERPEFLTPDVHLAGLARRLGGTESADPFLREDLGVELIAQILRRLQGRDGAPPPWLARIRDRIQDAPLPVSVATLAAEVGVHRVHLARAFREHFGRSVTAHMQRIRLRHARRLLADPDRSLADVAMSAGFADQSHMTRAIRAALGTTPGRIRRATLHPFKNASRRSA